MKSNLNYLKTGLFIILSASLQFVVAQTSHRKAAAQVKSGPAPANYISHEIAKGGPGDHGIFFDTVKSKLKVTDAINPAGKQYQDVKITLDAGDVIKAGLSSELITPMNLTLLGSMNGHLTPVKAIIDTGYHYNLFYKVPAAGVYTLRISCKKRASKDKNELNYYYESYAGYTVECVIATPASGVIMDSPTVCDQLQFLLRQRLTNYMQITGKLSDTTMDVLDKTKIQSVNYLSTFTFYKNSEAKVNIGPGFTHVMFDQSLQYNSDADAAQAQRYFIQQFKACLGEGWKEEVDPSNPNWHEFKTDGSHNIGLILYPGYKFLEILM